MDNRGSIPGRCRNVSLPLTLTHPPIRRVLEPFPGGIALILNLRIGVEQSGSRSGRYTPADRRIGGSQSLSGRLYPSTYRGAIRKHQSLYCATVATNCCLHIGLRQTEQCCEVTGSAARTKVTQPWICISAEFLCAERRHNSTRSVG